MKIRWVWPALIVLGSQTGAAWADTVGERAIAGYIAPAMQRYAEAAPAMGDALSAYCRGEADRERLDAAFGALAQSWARIEFLRFGPLVEANRYERSFFWPDPRGVTQRQVQAALARQDPALVAPGGLAAASVAVQGIPALELVLYLESGGLASQAPADADDYRCRYGQALTTALAGIGRELAAAWSPGGQVHEEFAHPGPDANLYRDDTEVIAELLKAVSGGLHFARDAKLVPALGATADTARPTRAPLARSGMALPAMAAGVRGAGELFAAAGLAPRFEDVQRWMAASVPQQAARIADALQTVEPPWAAALADAGTRSRLAAAAADLQSLKTMLEGPVAEALGVKVGFNALDGD
ncbi:imelysin family protein [Verticiella sediminum]|uniref:Imelysin family protein n=1 Tax=Verticiella sediminum TaxID=1247510 RepID=A0A556ABC1_9BURK|nr:imelysin family protein [Verticiella sediminum]TSH90196.1 imelysin family protein [Verticiella sediminum]